MGNELESLTNKSVCGHQQFLPSPIWFQGQGCRINCLQQSGRPTFQNTLEETRKKLEERHCQVFFQTMKKELTKSFIKSRQRQRGRNHPSKAAEQVLNIVVDMAHVIEGSKGI